MTLGESKPTYTSAILCLLMIVRCGSGASTHTWHPNTRKWETSGFLPERSSRGEKSLSKVGVYLNSVAACSTAWDQKCAGKLAWISSGQLISCNFLIKASASPFCEYS